MYNIILASHGDMAKYTLKTCEMILGEQEGVDSLCLQPGQTKDNYEAELKEKINACEGGEVLVLADIYGGTPFNSAITHILRGNNNITLLTGFNLPMVIHALMNREREIKEVIAEIQDVGIEGIRDVNEMLNSKDNE